MLNADRTDIKLVTYSRRGRCDAYGCSNAAKHRLCARCSKRSYRVRNPLKYSYNYHKQNAKKRGHDWQIPFPIWVWFWTVAYPEQWALKLENILKPASTAKVKNRGCLYEMDRIDQDGPYALSYKGRLQLQCVTKQVNVERQWDHQLRRNEWTVVAGQPGKLRLVFSTVSEHPDDYEIYIPHPSDLEEDYLPF